MREPGNGCPHWYISVYITCRLRSPKMAEEKTEPFELLEQTIEQFVETTRQIGIIVSDVQPGSQGVLNQKM